MPREITFYLDKAIVQLVVKDAVALSVGTKWERAVAKASEYILRRDTGGAFRMPVNGKSAGEYLVVSERKGEDGSKISYRCSKDECTCKAHGMSMPCYHRAVARMFDIVLMKQFESGNFAQEEEPF